MPPADHDHPFLISRDGTVALTYGQLCERLRDTDYRPLLRPASTAEALVGVLQALVRGAPLRLVDGDFSPGELTALDIDASRLDHRETLPGEGPADWTSAAATAASATGFSLELYTSGSTGLPKLVRHRLATLTRTLKTGERHRDSVWALAYNPTHIAGVQVLLQAFFNRNTLVDVFKLPRTGIWRLLETCGVTHLSATPTFYRLLLPAEHPLPRVRSLTLGGERSDPALLDRLASAFPSARLHNLYASTEAGTLLMAEGEVFGIHPAVEGRVKIEAGQLWVSRELLADFSGAQVASDWYATGDRVEITSEAPLRFRILGRDTDWVNVGGAKVNPAEVEAALLAHPDVRECRVYGRANSVVGTLLCAEIVSETPLDEAALRSHLAARLQPHKVPRVLKHVAGLALTRSGKLARSA